MAIKNFKETNKYMYKKTGFRVGLSTIFQSWGLPRKHQEPHKGSQEAPKQLQNHKKKEPKIEPNK